MLYLIVNPASKSGRGQKIFNELKAELNQNHIVYEAFLTDKRYGAEKCVKSIVERLERYQMTNPVIGVLGGDGTINEVINFFPETQSVSILYLPTGSSNDLARALHISTDIKAFILRYRAKEKKQTDIGLLTDPSSKAGTKRLFSVSCGIGIDAATCTNANNSFVKNFMNRIYLGKLSYAAIFIKQIFNAPEASCDITVSGGKSFHFEKVLFIVTMIHPYEGGGVKMTPMADGTDGYFDIMVISDLKRWQLLYLLPLAFFGKHTKAKAVHFFRTKSVTIQTSESLVVHTDGEYFATTDHISMECKKDGLNYI